MRSTILLTGASGNIGSHVLPELLRRGHEVRTFAGDVTEPAEVAEAVAGVDTVVHLAAVIPPESDEWPAWAHEVNIGGTRHVIEACRAQADPPRLLFTSTFDVHGRTQGKEPPRRVDDPLMAVDPYTEHKIECERLIRESELDWVIFRLTDVPVLGMRKPHPIMFEIGLDNRIEALHADDAALAIAGALTAPEVWGRVLFIGGGPSCQLTYREYLSRLLAAMGVKPLPDKAFSDAEYVTDWVDSTESEALMHYQRHTFDDIAEAIAASLGWRRRLVPLVEPFARRAMLKLSPYYKAR
ncbi:MAG TPA: NAD(P)-dependent oxidoreductase [Actinophytocola sp.]|uniref:NAD-dependent epimerase/dehydratase family protein n=1 Tax=Actinophytocola sp. TaxID=1872138 RepID=UPI002DF80B3C|nr:NAD(P)-dependent oxidoreductase [Actinophytocola sp.]